MRHGDVLLEVNWLALNVVAERVARVPEEAGFTIHRSLLEEVISCNFGGPESTILVWEDHEDMVDRVVNCVLILEFIQSQSTSFKQD